MEEEIKNEYISLREATKYCHYSQEYLSLRARQGKLKSVKFGHNWVTKEDWLEEYLKSVEEYKNNLQNNKAIKFAEALPIEKVRILESKIAKKTIFRFLNYKARTSFVLAIIFVLLITGGIFGKNYFQNIFENINSYSYSAAINIQPTITSTADMIEEYGKWLFSSTKNQLSKIKKAYFTANDFIEEKFSQTWINITQLLKKLEKVAKRELVLGPTKEGLVVVPSTEKDEEIKKKIEESFSDEVKVEIKDKTSGIIIPIFKKGEGEKYLYILVPIKN